MSKGQRASLCPLIIGAVLIIAGLLIRVPGGALTTYASLNGETTEFYEFDDRYSTIDEYVGGDAYNYIIGASLVAGRISGTMAVKAICIVGGTLCVCLGMTLWLLMSKNSSAEEQNETPQTATQNLTEDAAPEQDSDSQQNEG